MITFGPVPSRRLGRSLGINPIPGKVCSYGCSYCQVGRTQERRIERRAFHTVAEVVAAVAARVEACRRAGEQVDWLTFVPDGEPTLDLNLGEAVRWVGELGMPVAVITNGSLLGRADVRAELAGAAWVSVKVDTVDPVVWRRLNRPHRELALDTVLEGIRRFAQEYEGTLVSETMLVAGVNDDEAALRRVAGFLREVGVARAWLAASIRPPADRRVRVPAPAVLRRAVALMVEGMGRASVLFEDESDGFAAAGDPAAELLATVAVHPLREAALRRWLERAGGNWSLVESLVAAGWLEAVEHRGQRFFRRPAATQPEREQCGGAHG